MIRSDTRRFVFTPGCCGRGVPGDRGASPCPVAPAAEGPAAAPGDVPVVRLVVEGLQKVRDGAEVKPMTAEQMAQAAEAAKQAEAAKPTEGKHGKE